MDTEYVVEDPEVEIAPPRHYRERLIQHPIEGRWVFLGEWCWNDPLLERLAAELRSIKGSGVSIRCYGEPGCYLLFYKPPIPKN